MSDKTNIQWCDATWSPITGCSVISAGCRSCYAQQLAGTRMKHHPSRVGLTKKVNGKPVWTGEVRFNDQWLDQPLRWKKPRRVFVCAHADLFHENVPDEWIDKVFAVMALAPQHAFQVLTKRAERMRQYVIAAEARVEILKIATALGGSPLMSKRQVVPFTWPLPNVHLGVSVEDQENADLRIPDLLATPAAVRFLSCEPLLGPIQFDQDELGLWCDDCQDWHGSDLRQHCTQQGIEWVIVGGESGHHARPFDIAWARSVVAQCRAAEVACFIKQMGARPYDSDDLYADVHEPTAEHKREGRMSVTITNHLDLRDSHGGDMSEWPADLRVREFPQVRS